MLNWTHRKVCGLWSAVRKPARLAAPASRGQVWAVVPLLVAVMLLPSGPARAQAVFFDEAAQADMRAATPAADVAYLVQTGSRLVLPKASYPNTLPYNRDEKMFIQFERPLRAEERAELQAAGVVFHETLAPFTYLASVPASAVGALANHSLFRGLEPIVAADKVTATLFLDAAPEHALRAGGEVAVFFRFYQDVTLDQALAVLDDAGVSVPERDRLLFGNRLQATATPAQLLTASESPLVRAVFEVPPPPAVSNAHAAAIANVPPLRALAYGLPDGLSGSGIRIGIWDEGPVRNTHQDLAPRVFLREGVVFNDHASHVAGTMISSGAFAAAAKGIAPGGTLFSYDFNGNPVDEMSKSVIGDRILLSNNSWGSILGWSFDGTEWVNTGNANYFGLYSDSTREWDELVRDTGLIVMKAAMNDGTDCNPANPNDCDGIYGLNIPVENVRYDIIPHQSVAKNIITVGALEDDGVTRTDFSSTGPADDGRVKPDVVANGRGLTSTGHLSDSHYFSISGTSMATPVVSGVVALLTEQWRWLHLEARFATVNGPGTGPDSPTPELVKALLVNTATDLGRPGPDYAYGHGKVNAHAAVVQLEAPNAPGETALAPNQTRIGFIDEGEILEFDVLTATIPGSINDLTMAWTDPEYNGIGSVVRYCNQTNKAVCTADAQCTFGTCYPAACGTTTPCHLVNDLDVRAENTLGGTAWPFVLPGGLFNPTGPAGLSINHVDNVEKLRFADTPVSVWRVTVTGFSVPQGPQRFALASSSPLQFYPPNDDFADAKTLPALLPPDPTATKCASRENPCPATLYPHNQWHAVNFDATLGTGEPLDLLLPQDTERSVWFSWMATQNGRAVFDTAGADFDTMLAAYSGDNVFNLTQLALDDNAYGLQSRIAFDVLAGTTYSILVASRSTESMGVFPLNYHLEPPLPTVCGDGILEQGEACDDGNTLGGDCCSATCNFESSGSVCNIDGDICTEDTCDGAGTCSLGGPLCDDGNDCTDETCDPVSGCIFTNNTGPCEDFDKCTTNDTCSGGVCISGGPLVCDDGNACTDDFCGSTFGCLFQENTAPCDGGSACTTNDICGGGVCNPGAPVVCDDANVCTTDSCDPATGCFFTGTGEVADTLQLELQTILADQNFEAVFSITAGNDFVIASPANVHFDAPAVIIESGFTVNSGASFTTGNAGVCVAPPGP